MLCIAWTGTPPPRAVADRLRTRDIRIERDDPDDLPLVVSTATAAKLPAPRAERGRWVWLSGQAVPPARAMDAVMRGAYDVVALDAPDAMDRLVARLEELLTPDPPLPAADHLVQESAAACSVVRQVARAAQTAMAVLLTGETGTGKTYLARLIHEFSPRKDHRFLAVPCGALSTSLVESELFGLSSGTARPVFRYALSSRCSHVPGDRPAAVLRFAARQNRS